MLDAEAGALREVRREAEVARRRLLLAVFTRLLGAVLVAALIGGSGVLSAPLGSLAKGPCILLLACMLSATFLAVPSWLATSEVVRLLGRAATSQPDLTPGRAAKAASASTCAMLAGLPAMLATGDPYLAFWLWLGAAPIAAFASNSIMYATCHRWHARVAMTPAAEVGGLDARDQGALFEVTHLGASTAAAPGGDEVGQRRRARAIARIRGGQPPA